MPSYVTFNLHQEDDKEKSLQIVNLCLKCQDRSPRQSKCRQVHSWLLASSMIKSVM